MKILNKRLSESQESISCVTTIGVDAVKAALSHGPDQGLEGVLGDRLPFLLQIPKQDVEVVCRRVVCAD